MAIAAPLVEDDTPSTGFRMTDVGKAWLNLRLKAERYGNPDKVVIARAYTSPEVYFTPRSFYGEKLHTDEHVELAAQYERSRLSNHEWYTFLHIFSSLDAGEVAPSPYAIVSHEGPIRTEGDSKFLTRQYSVYARDERLTRSHEPIVTADSLEGIVDVMAPVFELDLSIGRCRADFTAEIVRDPDYFRERVLLQGFNVWFSFPVPESGRL